MIRFEDPEGPQAQPPRDKSPENKRRRFRERAIASVRKTIAAHRGSLHALDRLYRCLKLVDHAHPEISDEDLHIHRLLWNLGENTIPASLEAAQVAVEGRRILDEYLASVLPNEHHPS